MDMFANALFREFISDDEIENVLADMFFTYVVNTETVLAYAKQRKLEAEIWGMLEGFIPEKDTR